MLSSIMSLYYPSPRPYNKHNNITAVPLSVQITTRHDIKTDCGVGVPAVGNTCSDILVMVGVPATNNGHSVS